MRRRNGERGLTFVIVTHDLAIGRQTDRIIHMLDGRVVEASPAELDGSAGHQATPTGPQPASLRAAAPGA
jgi:ABC-type glutathione transport system ATPase component